MALQCSARVGRGERGDGGGQAPPGMVAWGACSRLRTAHLALENLTSKLVYLERVPVGAWAARDRWCIFERDLCVCGQHIRFGHDATVISH